MTDTTSFICTRLTLFFEKTNLKLTWAASWLRLKQESIWSGLFFSGFFSSKFKFNSPFSKRHSRACAHIKCTKNSRVAGFKSMLGALVKFSKMYWNVPADRKKLSTAASNPLAVNRSWRVPICVYRAPTLNKTEAFSKATVRWELGTPVKLSYLQKKSEIAFQVWVYKKPYF